MGVLPLSSGCLSISPLDGSMLILSICYCSSQESRHVSFGFFIFFIFYLIYISFSFYIMWAVDKSKAIWMMDSNIYIHGSNTARTLSVGSGL